MPNLIVMPKAFAFVSQTVNDPSKTTNADRFRIRRHVMLGLNKRVASRRSLREAARQADVSLATLTTDSGTRVPPSESTETSPDSADAEAHARRQTVRGQDGKRLGTEFETACLQLDRQIRTRSGVFASLDNTETACGELISECT